MPPPMRGPVPELLRLKRPYHVRNRTHNSRMTRSSTCVHKPGSSEEDWDAPLLKTTHLFLPRTSTDVHDLSKHDASHRRGTCSAADLEETSDGIPSDPIQAIRALHRPILAPSIPGSVLPVPRYHELCIAE